VCFLGRGNGLEISSSRAFDIAPVEGGGVKAGQPCEPVILPSKGRQAGGPPGFRAGARALGWGMRGKEGGKAGRGDVKPSTQGVGRGLRRAWQCGESVQCLSYSVQIKEGPVRSRGG